MYKNFNIKLWEVMVGDICDVAQPQCQKCTKWQFINTCKNLKQFINTWQKKKYL